MEHVVKLNWLGGMNSQLDTSKLDFGSGYYLGVNIRTRRNTAQSILAPLDITAGLPSGGTIQGIYTFGTTLLVFKGGSAFVKLNGTGMWNQLSSFAMSPTAPEIDCELVPASTVNFVRASNGTGSTQTTNSVVFTNPINASPQCLIVMDGVSQPRIIFENGTSRVTNNYTQWTSANPEYVPIGRYPLYSGGILYCVGKDLSGNYTQIYRSVSGRPLDYIILLNELGDKIDPASEANGGAPALSYRVSYSPTTAMARSNTSPGALIVSTALASFLVQPNYDSLIAAEPTFNNTFLFDVGAVSKTSIVDVLGDTTIVCKSGIRSFNGVQQTKFQGKNSPFSSPVNNFISRQEQTVTTGISYDDYAFYALATVFGPGVLVYDFLQQVFVSVDLYPNVGLIKQFAKVQTGTVERLYFYTTDNKVYQAFSGLTQKSKVFLGDITTEKPDTWIRPVNVACTFSNVLVSGYAEGILFSDKRRFDTGAQALTQSLVITNSPAELPFETDQADNCQQLAFDGVSKTTLGWRASAGIVWNADCELLGIDLEVEVADNQAGKVVVLQPPIDNVILDVVAELAPNIPGTSLSLINYVQLEGNVVLGAGNLGDYTTKWSVFHDNDSFYATAGPVEQAVGGGMSFYQWIQQGPDHYSIYNPTPNGCVRVFFVNSALANAATWTWLESQTGAGNGYNVLVMYGTISSSNPGVTALFTTIPFRSMGVDMIVTGAGEMYERLQMSDGLVVINAGTGGRSLYTGTLNANSNSRKVIQNTIGFLRITASPVTCKVEFITQAGQTLDTYGLQ